jgi:hypothetical protein
VATYIGGGAGALSIKVNVKGDSMGPRSGGGGGGGAVCAACEVFRCAIAIWQSNRAENIAASKY